MAVQVGPKILRNLFAELAAPLRRQLAIEAVNKGGRPQDLYRNYMVQELAAAYEEIHRTRPPSGKTGLFVKFCQTIFYCVGIETEGLEGAVARILRNQRRRSKEAPKPTS